MWKVYFELMKFLSSRFLQRSFWWLLRKTGIAGHLGDEGFLKLQLLGVTGEAYSLTNGGINSWILWQRLNYHSPILVEGCDKYAVRAIVKERIGEMYLTPLVVIDGRDHWTDPGEIDFAKLPRQFVLKLNNGSGMNIIVKDKAKLDWQQTLSTMCAWMKTDYASNGREWQYKGVRNKIICEKLIPTSNGEPPEDYKIMCSDGLPLYIWVDKGRFTCHKRNVYTPEWKDTGVRISFDRYIEEDIPKPKNLDLMRELAAKMSKGIPIVRIDFYNVNGQIFFGEMTFTPGTGIEITRPFSFSQKMARKIDRKVLKFK